MKVTIAVTKSHDFQIKGETKIFDNICQIIEKQDVVELIRNKNWATIVNKAHNKIIAIEY